MWARFPAHDADARWVPEAWEGMSAQRVPLQPPPRRVRAVRTPCGGLVRGNAATYLAALTQLAGRGDVSNVLLHALSLPLRQPPRGNLGVWNTAANLQGLVELGILTNEAIAAFDPAAIMTRDGTRTVLPITANSQGPIWERTHVHDWFLSHHWQARPNTRLPPPWVEAYGGLERPRNGSQSVARLVTSNYDEWRRDANAWRQFMDGASGAQNLPRLPILRITSMQRRTSHDGTATTTVPIPWSRLFAVPGDPPLELEVARDLGSALRAVIEHYGATVTHPRDDDNWVPDVYLDHYYISPLLEHALRHGAAFQHYLMTRARRFLVGDLITIVAGLLSTVHPFNTNRGVVQVLNIHPGRPTEEHVAYRPIFAGTQARRDSINRMFTGGIAAHAAPFLAHLPAAEVPAGWTCPICQQDNPHDGDRTVRPCANNHCFHEECLRRWVANPLERAPNAALNTTCPLCRAEMYPPPGGWPLPGGR